MAYTDTDSYVIHVKTDDIYDDFNQLNNHMDFSDYNKEHKCYDNSNKKVLGKFKDEVNGKIITEFIGLKPKMYAFKIQESKDKMTAKGVPEKLVKRDFYFDMYKQTFEDTNYTKQYVNSNCIRSNNHQIHSLNIN